MAILASASSIEEQAVVAKGQATHTKKAPIPSAFIFKQIAKSLVTADKEDGESDAEPATNDEPPKEEDDDEVSWYCLAYRTAICTPHSFAMSSHEILTLSKTLEWQEQRWWRQCKYLKLLFELNESLIAAISDQRLRLLLFSMC